MRAPLTLIVNYFHEREIKTLVEYYPDYKQALAKIEALRNEGYHITPSNYGLYRWEGNRLVRCPDIEGIPW